MYIKSMQKKLTFYDPQSSIPYDNWILLNKCFSVESISFDSPLLSDISAETTGVGGWGNGPVQEAEEDLNSALDEALENYDLAASWINNEGDKDVVRK